MRRHALIHALVAAADQQQPGLPAQPVGHALVEEPALRRKQHDLLARPAFRPDRFHRLEDRFRLEHHALTPAERTIIHGLVPVRSPVPQIVDADLDQARIAGTFHHAMRKRPLEKLREDRQQMENHGRFKSFNPSGNSTAIRFASKSISTQIARAKGIDKPPSTTSRPAPPESSQPETRPRDSPVRRSTTSQPSRSDWKNSPGSSGARSLMGTRTSAPASGSASEMV